MVFLLHRPTGLPPPSTLGGRFAGLIDLIRCGIGDHADHTRLQPPDPRTPLIWGYVGRLLTRFLALLAKVQAGTLRPARARPRRPAAGPPPPPEATAAPEANAAPEPPPPRPRLRLPGGFAWLLRRFPPRPMQGNAIAAGAEYLGTLLADPELLALIATAPQAGRMLRPLCHALGVAVPPALRLPPRPRRPRRLSPEAQAARAARTALRAAARAEEAWARRYRRQLGLPARKPADARSIADPPAPPVQARPPPKRA